MIRTKAVLILLIFLAALIQISVFSTWTWSGVGPQFWLAAVFFLYLNATDDKKSVTAFLLLYFVFYDSLTFSRPAFLVSLFLIIGVYLFQSFIGRLLGRKYVFQSALFLWLNLLAFLYLRLGQSFYWPIFLRQILVNFVFYLLAWPGLYLVRIWLTRNEKPQLMLKI